MTHSFVPIIKRVSTQKIMAKHEERDQHFKFHVSDNAVIFFAYTVKSLWHLISSEQRKLKFYHSYWDVYNRYSSVTLFVCPAIELSAQLYKICEVDGYDSVPRKGL